MENKLINTGQNSIMDNFIETDDILKCDRLLNPHRELHIRQLI